MISASIYFALLSAAVRQRDRARLNALPLLRVALLMPSRETNTARLGTPQCAGAYYAQGAPDLWGTLCDHQMHLTCTASLHWTSSKKTSKRKRTVQSQEGRVGEEIYRLGDCLGCGCRIFLTQHAILQESSP
jgi:hypothetical protein